MEEPFKVIIVGSGYIAQAEHIPGWLNVHPNSIAAVVSRRRDVLTTLSERIGAPAFTTLEEAIDAVEADAVHICTPPWVREDLIGLAASHGLHVLVEKPLALDSETAQRCADLASAAGVTLMVVAPRAYDTDITHARELVLGGAFGELLAMESLWRLALPPTYDILAPASGVSDHGYANAGVKGLAAQLLEESVHHLGLFRQWMPGARAQIASVETNGSFLHVSLRFGDVLAWHTNAAGTVHDERFNLYTTEGFISVRPWSAHFPWRFGHTEIVHRTGEVIQPALARRNGYWMQLADFVDTCRGRGDNRRSATDGVEDIRLVEQIVEHAATGGTGARP